MVHGSSVPYKINSKQSSNQLISSTTSTRGKDNNPDTFNVISNWNSSKLFLQRQKV